MKGWVKIAIGAGLVGGIGYALKMRRTSAEIEVVNVVNVHKLDFTGITIRVDSLIKNPTKGSLTLKHPFVKLIYKDATIGSSDAVNKDIKIPSYGQVQLDPIMIKVPLAGLFSLGADLLKALKENTGIKLNIKTVSTIDLGFKKLPYEKVEEVILKK